MGFGGWVVALFTSARTRMALSLLGACAATGLAPAAAASGASNPSLPAKEGSAPRPGPAVLYQAPAKAPQLENAPL